MWGIFVGLLASSVVLALNGLTIFGVDINIEYLPGLLFICGGVLIANAGSWKLSRQEWVITGVLAAIMVALVGSFAVRANIGKPLHASASYTVTAASAPELLAAIRAHIASERHAPPNLDLLAANLYYLRKDIARGPVQVELQLLGRQQRVTLPSTREYLVLCGLNPAVPHQWQVQQTMDAPPRQAVGLLAKLASPPPAPSSLDDLGLQTRLLRDAPAVPPVTPELLAPLLTALRKVPQGQAVLLRLIPTRVLIVDEHRNIQRLPYPSAVNKTKH